MALKPYRTAVIGTGAITATHLNALRNIPGFDVAGILGRDHERTRRVAADLGVHAFKDYDEILSDPDITVVDIATSSRLHAEYGLRAAQHRKNLIIEKPMGTSPERSAALIGLCEQNGTLLEVIYQHRYDEEVILLKRLIEQGVLGKIKYVKFSCRPKRDHAYYSADMDNCRGVLRNNAIHYIDLMMYFMGKRPVSCQGVIRRTRPEITVEDYAHVMLEFENAAICEVDILTNVRKSLPTVTEVEGEKGSIVFWGKKIRYASLDLSSAAFWRDAAYRKVYIFEKLKIPLRFHEGSHEDVFRGYLSSLQGLSPVSVDGKTALSTLKIVEDIYSNSRNIL